VSKVLVVDDNPDARELLSSILKLERLEVVTAADGVEGIERARSELPDLIIADLAMPRLPGIEMIRKLRRMKAFKHTPILAVTSHQTERAVAALRAGANLALTRPVDNHLLLMFVFDLLKERIPTAAKSVH
jgi:CheY-like chemotaxis protein